MSIAPVLQESRRAYTRHSPMKPLNLDGIQTLVVDDNSAAGMLLDVFLTRLGATVMVAQSVPEAIGIFSSSLPDILISDIWLGESNGYELIQWVRSRPLDQGRVIPAIALSADITTKNQHTALISGFQSFVPKPVRLPTLALTLHHLLE